MILHFVESPIFSEQIDDLLEKEDQRRLQLFRLVRPNAGDLIRGSGGLRKLRWARSGQGKRGAIRVIYYLFMAEGHDFHVDGLHEEKTRRFDPPAIEDSPDSDSELHQ